MENTKQQPRGDEFKKSRLWCTVIIFTFSFLIFNLGPTAHAAVHPIRSSLAPYETTDMFRVLFRTGLAEVFQTRVARASETSNGVKDEIADRQRQIDEIQKQIDDYERQIEETHSKSQTLGNEIAGMNAKISQLTLEIRSLELSIKQTSVEISDTETKISDASDKILKHKNALGQFIKVLYEADRKTLTEVLLKNDRLSDFFSNLNSIQVTQNNLESTIKSIKGLKNELEGHQNDLEDKKSDLEKEKRLQDISKSDLNKNKADKNKLLQETKGQESKFQQLVKKSQKDIEAIRGEITYLEQNGVTAEEAVKYGQLAAIRTGIRPEYLIAELEHESRLGANVGKCNRAGDPPSKGYRVIMKPGRDIEPFLTITAQLGLDPETTAVSCPQSNGWGGAMGPAQFIPSTWMGYKDEVAQLTGHNPANPWNIEDAFIAAAAKLSRAGADSKTRAGEVAASKAYYCGNPKSARSACINYANRVQALALEIAKNL